MDISPWRKHAAGVAPAKEARRGMIRLPLLLRRLPPPTHTRVVADGLENELIGQRFR